MSNSQNISAAVDRPQQSSMISVSGISQFCLQIDLNEKSYQQIVEKMALQNMMLGSSSQKSMLVKEFFVRLIQGGAPSQMRTPTRHLTIETINRYIFTLNEVQQPRRRGHISEVELRKCIKLELEKDKRYEMDKKTLRRIVENLKREGLVKTKQFKVTIYQDKVNSRSQQQQSLYYGGSANYGSSSI